MALSADDIVQAGVDTADMLIVHHGPQTRRFGVPASAVAGPGTVQMWLLHLEAGMSGSVCRHVGELVVVALAGTGKLFIDGIPQRFSAPCSVVVPAGSAWQLANYGAPVLEMLTVGTGPVVEGDGPTEPT